MKYAAFTFAMVACVLAQVAVAAPPAAPQVTFNADGSFVLSEAFEVEMYCIIEDMKQRDRDDYGAMLVLNGDNPTAKAAFEQSSAVCIEDNLWGQREQVLGKQMSENSAIFDFQLLELSLIGVDQADLEAVLGDLSPDDRSRFLQNGWNLDVAFVERINTALKAHGVRDNQEILFNASIALGAYMFLVQTTDEWVRLWRKANP